MNHAITLGGLLLGLVILGGIVAVASGLLMVFAGGMSDAPAAGDDASRTGCITSVVGIVIVVGAALLLAGCAGSPPVQDRVVEVKVPVAVQPITAAQVPVVPAPLGPRPATLQQSADTLLAKVCEFVGYALKADPLLRISAGEHPRELAKFPECEGR